MKQYIEAQTNRWSKTTLKSESARLLANVEAYEAKTAEAAWNLLKEKGLAPYSIKITMIRLADCKAFHGDASWKLWIRQNANLFKNAYKKETIDVEFKALESAILGIVQDNYRRLAQEILHSGLRSSEALHRHVDHVNGKGGKVRPVFAKPLLEQAERSALTYKGLWAACKSVGIKPHTLRKAFATKLARSGRVGEADMLRIMGWSSIQTASSYLQPHRDAKLAEIVLDEVTRDKS